LTAVVFGLIEMRRARKERDERAAFIAVQAILTPAWMESMTLAQAIAEGTTPSQIEADPPGRPVHSLHSRIAWLCRLCAHGSVERSRRTAGRHGARSLAQIAWLR
jgi:hypothetical protein